MSWLKTLLPIPIALALTACQTDDSGPPPEEWSQAKALWESSGIVSYQFTLTRDCYCVIYGDVVISVAAGEITTAYHQETETDLNEEQIASLYTLDGLFDLLERAYEDGADKVDVEYDETLGYPITLYIDWDKAAADEESRYSVGDFQAY